MWALRITLTLPVSPVGPDSQRVLPRSTSCGCDRVKQCGDLRIKGGTFYEVDGSGKAAGDLCASPIIVSRESLIGPL